MRTAGWASWTAGATMMAFVGGLLLGPRVVQAQELREITGRVTAADTHERVPEATVTVPGTTIGAATGDSGTFRLRVPDNATSLLVRRIGFLARTVPLVAGQADYTVALSRDVLHLQQQVVTGLATTISSQSAANNVSVVNAQQLVEVPAPTVENALQAQAPGVLIGQNNGGAPGGGMTVEIRGITSIYGIAAPLYVVDGVIVNDAVVNSGTNAITNAAESNVAANTQDNGVNRIADLNPDDIATVEVLKGASATSIYGSKASAGVIVITTKKGTTGKPLWEISQKVGHFADAQQLGLRQFPTLASAQAWGAPLGHSAAQVASVYAGPQNYQSQLFGNSQASYETDVSVSGLLEGTGTQYFLSALSKYDNGIQINSGYQKNSIRANLTQKFASNLTATANLFYDNSLTRRSFSGNDNNGIAPFDVLSYSPQFVMLDHPNADGVWPTSPYGPANPFANAAQIQTPEQVGRFIGGGNVTWTPWTTEHQNLQVNFNGGADLTNQTDNQYAPPTLQFEQALTLPGVASTNTANTLYTNVSLNLIHHYSAGSNLDFTTSVGALDEHRHLVNPQTVSQDLIPGTVSPAAGVVEHNFFTETAQHDQSWYAQEQVLTLGQRLNLTVGVTSERTTNDGNIDKFYSYPRYAASYRIPQFAGFLDELKVRAAYGQSGTQPLYGVRYTPFTTLVASSLPGIVDTTTLGDPNIKPETETEIETGFDATMFHSRAQFSATVYQKRITNLLLRAGVAPSLGYTSDWLNGGELTNQGIELSLTATPVQMNRGLTWITTTTFYRNISDMNTLPVPGFSNGGFGGGYGTIFEAANRSVSEVVNSNVTNAAGIPAQLGDADPAIVMDFSNNFTLGPFRLSTVVEWQRGSLIQNVTNSEFDFGSLLLGDTTLEVQRLKEFTQGLAPYVEPGSFIKLRDVALSYTFPTSWTHGLLGGRISTARLSLDARNLLHSYAAGFTGLDPETNSQTGQDVARGVELTEYPPAVSYFLSLNLGL